MGALEELGYKNESGCEKNERTVIPHWPRFKRWTIEVEEKPVVHGLPVEMGIGLRVIIDQKFDHAKDLQADLKKKFKEQEEKLLLLPNVEIGDVKKLVEKNL